MHNYSDYGSIVCSAIRKNHLIYCGENHSECLRGAPRGYLRDGEQGFLTESGVFVDRKLGLEIAIYFKQIVKKHNPMDELLSEDLIK